MKVLKAASDAGDANSAYFLARRTLLNPEADHAEAVELLKRAAAPPQVLHVAAFALGNLYHEKDVQKAVTWWRVAGQKGFPPAMGNVGAFQLNEVLDGIDRKEDVASKAKEADRW